MQLAQKSLKLVVSAVAALLLCSCAAQRQEEIHPEHPMVASRLHKYVSMAPSNTELLFSLGAQDQLIGVCTQCDYPKEAKSLPKVGNFVTPDMEKLASLQPDGVFLVTGQEPIRDMIERQKAFRCRVVLLHNEAIDDIPSNLLTLGSLTGHVRESGELSDKFREAYDDVQRICGKADKKPTVFFCVWPEPLVAIGSTSYIDDAITRCGGKNISGKVTGAYPRFNLEKLVVENPDVIIMPDEADHSVAARAPWSSLQAVKNKRLYFLPPRDADRLSRPTLRTVEGMYWLAERLHPELAQKLSMSKNSISQDLKTMSK